MELPDNIETLNEMATEVLDEHPVERLESPDPISDQEEDYPEIELPDIVPLKKRKNKRTKPKSKRGLNKPTGFEEYHAEGPLTLEQHVDDQERYDPKLPFSERILTAIQRFERTRKLTSERSNIFYKYLAYGGIEVGPNMFQGRRDLKSLDKSQLAAALAQTSLKDEMKDPELLQQHYVVDFLGCMKGFLSRRAILIDGFESQNQVNLVTTTLERFMDYLLLHNVCPEYKFDVLAARSLCRGASSELWCCAEALRLLPGSFNIACSTLFDGSYSRNYDGHTNWGPEDMGPTFVGITPEEATQIMHYAIAGSSSEEVFNSYLTIINGSKQFQVLQVKEDVGFEITNIEPPTAECLEIYQKSETSFQPVGRVTARAWKNPNAPPEDLTDEELLEFECKGTKQQEEYIFFIESPILSKLLVGMKVEATIRQLDCGVWFFDEVIRVYPSFDTWLCNELMIGYKKPKPVKGAMDYIDEDEDLVILTAEAEEAEQ